MTSAVSHKLSNFMEVSDWAIRESVATWFLPCFIVLTFCLWLCSHITTLTDPTPLISSCVTCRWAWGHDWQPVLIWWQSDMVWEGRACLLFVFRLTGHTLLISLHSFYCCCCCSCWMPWVQMMAQFQKAGLLRTLSYLFQRLRKLWVFSFTKPVQIDSESVTMARYSVNLTCLLAAFLQLNLSFSLFIWSVQTDSSGK